MLLTGFQLLQSTSRLNRRQECEGNQLDDIKVKVQQTEVSQKWGGEGRGHAHGRKPGCCMTLLGECDFK